MRGNKNANLRDDHLEKKKKNLSLTSPSTSSPPPSLVDGSAHEIKSPSTLPPGATPVHDTGIWMKKREIVIAESTTIYIEMIRNDTANCVPTRGHTHT